MPRRSAAEARATRTSIITRATDVATVDGLEGLTIGRLAADLGMSKAGVMGHFGTKEALQLATVEAAAAEFRQAVWDPAASERPGLRRLRAVADTWIDHIAVSPFAGGCFWSAASPEFDGRPGPVRDAIAGMQEQWSRALRRDAATAIENGELPAGEDPAQIAFELRAVAIGLNQELQLHDHKAAIRHARRAVKRILMPAR
jgi:AcrR family transcriptional regulator